MELRLNRPDSVENGWEVDYSISYDDVFDACM